MSAVIIGIAVATAIFGFLVFWNSIDDLKRTGHRTKEIDESGTFAVGVIMISILVIIAATVARLLS